MKVKGTVWNGKEYELVEVEISDEQGKRLFGGALTNFSIDKEVDGG